MFQDKKLRYLYCLGLTQEKVPEPMDLILENGDENENWDDEIITPEPLNVKHSKNSKDPENKINVPITDNNSQNLNRVSINMNTQTEDEDILTKSPKSVSSQKRTAPK